MYVQELQLTPSGAFTFSETPTEKGPIPIGAVLNEAVTWTKEVVLTPIPMGTPLVMDQDDVRVAEIVSRLAALGDNVTRVAKSLANQDITGVIGSPTHCPIAQWMQKNFGYYGPVHVGGSFIDLLTSEAVYRIKVPEAVGRFIAAFDKGAFPKLLVRSDGYTTTKTIPTKKGLTDSGAIPCSLSAMLLDM
jgi:hypothetical protein